MLDTMHATRMELRLRTERIQNQFTATRLLSIQCHLRTGTLHIHYFIHNLRIEWEWEAFVAFICFVATASHVFCISIVFDTTFSCPSSASRLSSEHWTRVQVKLSIRLTFKKKNRKIYVWMQNDKGFQFLYVCDNGWSCIFSFSHEILWFSTSLMISHWIDLWFPGTHQRNTILNMTLLNVCLCHHSHSWPLKFRYNSTIAYANLTKCSLHDISVGIDRSVTAAAPMTNQQNGTGLNSENIVKANILNK